MTANPLDPATIRARRHALGLSAGDLARLAGVSRRALRAIEEPPAFLHGGGKRLGRVLDALDAAERGERP